MKKLILISLSFAGCAEKSRRVCDYADQIVVERHDFRTSGLGGVYYYFEDKERDITIIEALQIDYDLCKVGDTVKACK